MKNRQITEIMRDIAPKYQNKANERAAEVHYTPRRTNIQSLLVGGAALGCAVFAAVIILPHMNQKELTAPDSALEESIESTEEAYAVQHASAPFDDISGAFIRFISPAYAPFALEISAEEQYTLADVLSAADWKQTGSEFDDSVYPDGEHYTMCVKQPDTSFFVTFMPETHTARMSQDGTQWTLYELPDEVFDTVRSTVQKDDGELDGHLTWVEETTLNTQDFWKNFRVDAKECDMTKKEDVFYKMNNAIDYYDSVSGVVLSGRMGGFDTKYVFDRTEFQADLNTGKGYDRNQYFYGNSVDEMISGTGDIRAEEAVMVYVMDAEATYSYEESDDTYYKFNRIEHRIDALPVADNSSHDTDLDVDGWVDWQNRLICNGIGMECLHNTGISLSYLYNFNNWDIVGTEVVNGRQCVHIHGHAPETDNELVFFKDSGSVKTFDIYADEETGVLVRLLGYDDNGETARFIETLDLAFNENAVPVQSPDLSGRQENTFEPLSPAEYEADPNANGEEVPAQDPAADETITIQKET